ncbi:hypothetical protein BCV69DRAFT_143626 [Microstroma glucosiphilum]|uniref:Uncharacterized protein n=1 Tax=Pseudomicrostroma glucosiphilum TaxID=1684307 RepID=A0A316UB95_9BASI|nr:hypothetical protein BCV69DRAFT_143626 [Pseudomicrostroma glucosiphilum]PWN22432.1 hypothetical protein BCV69DRAFT_143626 [Pseudomicrostroma glucosiphilum]
MVSTLHYRIIMMMDLLYKLLLLLMLCAAYVTKANGILAGPLLQGLIKGRRCRILNGERARLPLEPVGQPDRGVDCIPRPS